MNPPLVRFRIRHRPKGSARSRKSPTAATRPREVTTVWETEFKGHVVSRTLACRYTLSDGREETIGEGDPALPAAAKVLTPEQSREVASTVLDLGYVGTKMSHLTTTFNANNPTLGGAHWSRPSAALPSMGILEVETTMVCRPA